MAAMQPSGSRARPEKMPSRGKIIVTIYNAMHLTLVPVDAIRAADESARSHAKTTKLRERKDMHIDDAGQLFY